MKVLITDGTGYVDGTVTSACEDTGRDVVVLDDFSTGRREFIGECPLYGEDIADDSLLDRLSNKQRIDVVVHCAAKIIIPESVSEPLAYYENNVAKAITLLAALRRSGVKRFLFSSSASIYVPDENFVVIEGSPLQPGSPCARTKFMVELVLEDFIRASDVRVASLRYFNPINADPKLCSDRQLEKPSHVLAELLEAWVSKGTFTVAGVDWPTRDGSDIRGFVHVWGLAWAHIAALERFDEAAATDPYQIFNIDTGNGVTIKGLAASFERITGDPLKARFDDSHPGDVAGVYIVSTKAKDVLGWEAELTETNTVCDVVAWLPVRKERLGY